MAVATTTNTTRPRARGYQARLDELLLQVAAAPDRQIRFRTADLAEDRINTVTNPEDIRQEYGSVFSRSDFTGGAGLDRAHSRTATDFDSTRFWQSLNVDVLDESSGDPARVRLAHANTAAWSSTVATQPRLHSVTGGVSSVYWSNGSTLYKTASTSTPIFLQTYSDPAVSWTDIVPGENGPSSIPYVYTTNQSVITRWSPQLTGIGSWQKNDGVTGGVDYAGLSAVTRLWWVKDRLIGARNQTTYDLYEISQGDPTGTTGCSLLRAARFPWTEVIDAGSVILAASFQTIYAFQADTDGDLVLVGETNLHNTIRGMFFMNGVLFVATGSMNVTIWTADVGTDGRVTNMQSIVTVVWNTSGAGWIRYPIWGGSRYVYFGGSDSEGAHLYRYSLASGGYVRLFTSSDSTFLDRIIGIGVLDYDDAPLWLLQRNSGTYTLQATSTAYCPSGYLIGPLADFYSAAPKVWAGARLEAERPNIGGYGQTTAAMYVTEYASEINTPDSWTWTLAVPSNPTDFNTEHGLNITTRALATKIVLTSFTGANGSPTVYSYSLRAWPLVTDVIVEVPVNVSDRVERPGKQPLTVPGRGQAVWEALKAKEGSRVELQTYRPGDTVVGVLQSVTLPVQGISDRGTPTTYALVTVRGQRT